MTTIDRIAEGLAKKHGATIGCTVTTGILARIAANAANEDELAGKKKITPYWRALKANGELNPNYPGGIDNLIRRLESEGHLVVRKGKRFLVDRYEEKLAGPFLLRRSRRETSTLPRTFRASPKSGMAL